MNIAQKRAKKALRRKAVVAEKRKAEAFEATLAGRVRRAAGAPIRHCLLHQGLFESGIGTLILARGMTTSQFVMAVFLIDVFCLGIKDVQFRTIGAEELTTFVEMAGEMAPLVPVEPAYARKLLREVAAWARSIGFEPHADFATVEAIFGDVSPAASDAVFRFGCNGKPLYIPGPSDSPTLVRRRVEQLRRQLGDEGFDLPGPV